MIKFANLWLVITRHCPHHTHEIRWNKIRFHHVMVMSRCLQTLQIALSEVWWIIPNDMLLITLPVWYQSRLHSPFVQEGCIRIARVALDRKECDNALKRRVHASCGSFPKGYKLPVPRQFQPIYYSCCFDVRLAAGCCDTGSQSKTLVGTTDRLAVDATSRNLYSLQPKARMDGRKIHGGKDIQEERVGWAERSYVTYRTLVGSFVCWRFIRFL